MTVPAELRHLASPTSLSEAIHFNREHGLKITPVKAGEKAGYKKGWSAPGHCSEPSDFRIGDNIGVLNGTEVVVRGIPWYFTDVDIDERSEVVAAR